MTCVWVKNRKTETVVSITKRKLFVVFSYNTDMKENEKKSNRLCICIDLFPMTFKKIEKAGRT